MAYKLTLMVGGERLSFEVDLDAELQDYLEKKVK